MCIFPPSNISEIRVGITLVGLTEFECYFFSVACAKNGVSYK